MGCKYLFYSGGKHVELTYQLLVEELLKNTTDSELLLIDDIVYSKGDKQTVVFEKLKDLKNEFIEEVSTDPLENAPSYGENIYTPQTLINDPTVFHSYEKFVPIKRLDTDDYIEAKTQAYIEEDHMDPDKAKEKAIQDSAYWKVINLDSLAWHKLVNSYNWRKADRESWRVHLQGTKFESVADSIYNQMTGDRSVQKMLFGSHKRGDISAKIITSLNLKAKLSTSEKEIVGHFDNIMIDADGRIHVYNYKYSSGPISEWGSHKIETYKYEMAILKLILAANGYDVKDCTLHIIPIKMEYNDDYSSIEKATIYTHSFNPKVDLEFTFKNGRYVFDKYDRVARYLIPSESKIEGFSSEEVTTINRNLSFIFPNKHIQADGVHITAMEWILANYNDRMRNRILKTDKGYKVFFDKDYKNPILVEDSTEPSKNLKLISLVEDHINELQGTVGLSVNNLYKVILSAYENNKQTVSDLGALSNYISGKLSKYLLMSEDENGKEFHAWKLLDNDVLASANILVFLNVQTNQIDVITLCGEALRSIRSIKGNTNILGDRVNDIRAGELIDVKNSGENILAIRTAVIINEVLPKITNINGALLGDLKIISLANEGEQSLLNFKDVAGKILPAITKKIKVEEPDFKFSSNYTENTFVNPIRLLFELYLTILNLFTLPDLKNQFLDLGIEGLESESDLRKRKDTLIEIASRIETILRSKYILRDLSPRVIINRSKISKNVDERNLCNLYILVQNALSHCAGYYIAHEYKLNWAEENLPTQNAVANRTYRGVVNIFTRYVDEIADETSKKFYSPDGNMMSFSEDLKLFYKLVGFTSAQADLIGNLASVFENLFIHNDDGTRIMLFKNPYSDDYQNHMTSYEREFLKRTLFRINKTRCKVHGIKFDFTGVDDPRLLEFMNKAPWYFNVPLKKARPATLRTNTSIKDRLMNRAKSLKQKIGKLRNGVDEKVKSEINEGIYDWQLTDAFVKADGVSREGSAAYLERNKILASLEPNYWETDLESLVVDYEEEYIRTRELNKALIEVKSTLLQLELLGEGITLSKGFQQTIDLIHKFVKKNFFEKSLLEPETLLFMENWIDPFRKLVSRAYIAGNVISMFRDTFEGLWLNYARVVNKYHSDLSGANITTAYKEVVLNMFHDTMSINKMDLLCKIYRLSNSDIGRISDSVKSGRGGIFNYENWLYATLRKPDYLNRMVLFVARCMQDGSWDAFSVNPKTGELIYDWKLDKRFKAYADNNTSDTEAYQKAKEAYYNALLQYNIDHNTNLLPKDGLPEAYSFLEIASIRELSNNIYGSYDKAMRSGFENMTAGVMFGTFTTWMNGLWNNYTRKPGIYNEYTGDVEQETDFNGNNIFLGENLERIVEIKEGDKVTYRYVDSGKEYTGDTSKLEKSMAYVPEVVLGIWYSLVHATHAFRDGKFMKEIWLDPKERKNIDKLISDLLIALLFATAFKLADPVYQDFKKDKKGHSAFEAGVAQVLYSASSRSYDGFLGPINVITHIGENSNPPFYTLPVKIITDLGEFAFGSKTWDSVLTGNIALFRPFLEAMKVAKALEA